VSSFLRLSAGPSVLRWLEQEECHYFFTRLLPKTGNFAGAGPEYEQAIDQLPQAPTPIARPERYPGVRQGFAAAVTFAMVFGVTMLSGAAAMYLFPGISEAELGSYIARLFVISAGCATVLAFGKDAVSFVTEKIAGRFGQRG
jgi:hypothetical protein